ncbi:hypothetical protein B0H13DRAFT_1179945 [Mycena leptocephala]|nr:hypothetical protein B0H13DRAFT_1179945 [Mycena leptocephala]
MNDGTERFTQDPGDRLSHTWPLLPSLTSARRLHDARMARSPENTHEPWAVAPWRSGPRAQLSRGNVSARLLRTRYDADAWSEMECTLYARARTSLTSTSASSASSPVLRDASPRVQPLLLPRLSHRSASATLGSWGAFIPTQPHLPAPRSPLPACVRPSPHRRPRSAQRAQLAASVAVASTWAHAHLST